MLNCHDNNDNKYICHFLHFVYSEYINTCLWFWGEICHFWTVLVMFLLSDTHSSWCVCVNEMRQTRACSASCSSSILLARARLSICSKAFTFPRKVRLAGSSRGWSEVVSSAGPVFKVKLGFRATGGGRGLLLVGASLLTVLLERESKLLESAGREVARTCRNISYCLYWAPDTPQGRTTLTLGGSGTNDGGGLASRCTSLLAGFFKRSWGTGMGLCVKVKKKSLM